MGPGNDELGPGLMSLTIVVPAAVPSLHQTSVPFTPSSAEKHTSLPRATRYSGSEPSSGVGSMSLTIAVPAAVPSLRQSS